jgi:hypothetical protein
VEDLMDKPDGKSPTKTERKKAILANPLMIDPKGGLWSRVAQGGNFNKSEVTEVGRKEKPIKQPIQSNEKTKVPVIKHPSKDDRHLILNKILKNHYY